MMHTKGPWRAGTSAQSVVADTPTEDGLRGSDQVQFYGGHLIAESIAPSNRPLIIAAPELVDVLTQMVEWYGKRNITSEDDALLPAERQAPEITRAMELLARINGRTA